MEEEKIQDDIDLEQDVPRDHLLSKANDVVAETIQQLQLPD